MTHDELLKRIIHLYQYDFGRYEKPVAVMAKALCAVVELHKPKEEVTGMGVTFEGVTTSLSTQLRCGCGALYPCLTVQSIEKELG